MNTFLKHGPMWCINGAKLVLGVERSKSLVSVTDGHIHRSTCQAKSDKYSWWSPIKSQDFCFYCWGQLSFHRTLQWKERCIFYQWTSLVLPCNTHNQQVPCIANNWPVMLPCFAPSKCCACVMKSISPTSSTAGPVQHTGRAKLILTEWILQATTPNQWHAAEQKAWAREQGDTIHRELKCIILHHG